MPYGDERAKLRIAMVAACPFPWPRGTPVRILRLAEGLHKLGHEVHVITYHLGDRSTRLGFDVHRIRDVPSYRKVTPGPTLQKLTIVDILLWRELRRFLKRVPVDLIHAHHYEGLLTAYAATKFRKDPVIYDAHTLLGGELPYYRIGLPAGLKKSVGKRLDRIIPHLAHHTIAVTQQIERQIRDDAGVSPQGISVIPNGVELELFQQAYQGIELLLQAFALLTRNRPTCRLRFVTDSPFEPYEQLACDLGIRERVEIVSGAFSGVPEQLHQADVLVNPRVNCDGLPQKLLNYMAAGKPIVSFAGSAKTLEHEKNGLIVQDGDVRAFAAAMTRFLDDSSLSVALGAQALETARARSWDVVAEQIEQVYRKVLRVRPESS